ncbi:MAG: ATP-binding protein [Ruminiclostridium sp.]|nr:ATP-binding protein [Ruminiclostridium sp.]
MIRTLDIEARRENLDDVIGFIDALLEDSGCPMKTQLQTELAVEEIFINIASYAYEPDIGKAKISAGVSGEPPVMTMVFEDSGVPYDPLAKEDPDITLPAKERRVGGLGILLVKKNMDDVKYEYRDGKNILTLTKYINS